MTKDFFLIYGNSDLIVSGYMDVSFQIDRDDFKSQSSYVYIEWWRNQLEEFQIGYDCGFHN